MSEIESHIGVVVTRPKKLRAWAQQSTSRRLRVTALYALQLEAELTAQQPRNNHDPGVQDATIPDGNPDYGPP